MGVCADKLLVFNISTIKFVNVLKVYLYKITNVDAQITNIMTKIPMNVCVMMVIIFPAHKLVIYA